MSSVENIIIYHVIYESNKKFRFIELYRVLEDIAKKYASPAATIWLKVTNNRKPTKVEYDNHISFNI